MVPNRSTPEMNVRNVEAAMAKLFAGGGVDPVLLGDAATTNLTAPAGLPAARVNAFASAPSPASLVAPPVPAAQPAPQAEPTQAPATPEEEPIEEEKKPPQFRLRPRSELGHALYEKLKANPYMTEEQALAEIQAAKAPKSEAKLDAAPEVTLPEGTPKTAAEVKQAILDARKARDTASAEADFDAEEAANRRIDALVDALPAVQEYEASLQRVHSQSVQKEFDAAYDQAADFYPDFANENSEFHQAVLAREEEARLTGDPVFGTPKAPLFFAREVAKEWTNLGKVVRRKSEASGSATPSAAPVPPPAPPARAAVVPPIAPASASASNQATPALLSEMESIRTPAQLERFMSRFGVKSGFSTR